jgi:hypothetical protein
MPMDNLDYVMSNKCATQKTIADLNWGGTGTIENNDKLCTVIYATTNLGAIRSAAWPAGAACPGTKIVTMSGSVPIEIQKKPDDVIVEPEATGPSQIYYIDGGTPTTEMPTVGYPVSGRMTFRLLQPYSDGSLREVEADYWNIEASFTPNYDYGGNKFPTNGEWGFCSDDDHYTLTKPNTSEVEFKKNRTGRLTRFIIRAYQTDGDSRSVYVDCLVTGVLEICNDSVTAETINGKTINSSSVTSEVFFKTSLSNNISSYNVYALFRYDILADTIYNAERVTDVEWRPQMNDSSTPRYTYTSSGGEISIATKGGIGSECIMFLYAFVQNEQVGMKSITIPKDNVSTTSTYSITDGFINCEANSNTASTMVGAITKTTRKEWQSGLVDEESNTVVSSSEERGTPLAIDRANGGYIVITPNAYDPTGNNSTLSFVSSKPSSGYYVPLYEYGAGLSSSSNYNSKITEITGKWRGGGAVYINVTTQTIYKK